VADTEYARSAIRISCPSGCCGFAQGSAQEILARVGLNGHEIIPVGGFQFALETIPVDLLHPSHEVGRTHVFHSVLFGSLGML
jgi:hypothetical protein